MKILYALSNREGAKTHLLRFLPIIQSKHTIKIAAYNRSSPNVNIDWNLEALRYTYNPDILVFDNENLQTYYDQVKYFGPDLIISDMEIFTSHIATSLGVKIWQVSPLLLHYATPHKEKIGVGLYKYYPYLFNDPISNQHIKNILFNADRKFVYSHFGDIDPFQLEAGFEWVRPYSEIGKVSQPCEHEMVAVSYRNDRQIIKFLKRNKDSILFSNSQNEMYAGIVLKDLQNTDEYSCNLQNCSVAVNQGHTNFLADAFYNGKYSLIIPDFKEEECLTNMLYSKYLGLGEIIYDAASDFSYQNVELNKNNKIKCLDEYIEEL